MVRTQCHGLTQGTIGLTYKYSSICAWSQYYTIFNDHNIYLSLSSCCHLYACTLSFPPLRACSILLRRFICFLHDLLLFSLHTELSFLSYIAASSLFPFPIPKVPQDSHVDRPEPPIKKGRLLKFSWRKTSCFSPKNLCLCC